LSATEISTLLWDILNHETSEAPLQPAPASELEDSQDYFVEIG
jgi:hypothetical protein